MLVYVTCGLSPIVNTAILFIIFTFFLESIFIPVKNRLSKVIPCLLNISFIYIYILIAVLMEENALSKNILWLRWMHSDLISC